MFTWTNDGSGTIANIVPPTVVSQTGGTFSGAGGTLLLSPLWVRMRRVHLQGHLLRLPSTPLP